MKIVRQVAGAIAIFLTLTGCAVATHAPEAIPSLPSCENTLLELNHLSTSLATKSHIPSEVPGPMHFCRYRWSNNENRLTLMADDTELLAPIGILQALSTLKTVNEVYGPNAVFFCPMMQGNADVIVLQGASSSELTVIQVQRDGCGRVILTHPGSVSYIVYLSSAQLLTQLDAITATGGGPTRKLPHIRVVPSTDLHDGERVLVQVSGASPGERFRLSECATAAAASISGCGEQLAIQPFIDTDPSGSGSTTYNVRVKAATLSFNSTLVQMCTDQCVIVATGTNLNGQPTFFKAPLRFSR